MAADLLALETEIRTGRLSLDNFLNGKLVVAKLNEGFVEFDFESYNCLPEGYIFHYGINNNGDYAYFVNLHHIRIAEQSAKWSEICIHTEAKSGIKGIAIRRKSDKVRGHKDIATIAWDEWHKIKDYAIKPKRSNCTKSLRKETERYAIDALYNIAEHLKIHVKKHPSVVIAPNDPPSRYIIPENKIIIAKFSQATIYEEAGHCLHAGYMTKIPDKSFLLDMLFRKSIEEAVGYYCAKIGDNTHSVEKVLMHLYGIMPNEKKEKEDMLAKRIFNLDLSNDEMHLLSEGKICNTALAETYYYLKNDRNNILSLSHNLGARLGDIAFRDKDKAIIKNFILSESREYSCIFLQAVKTLKSAERLKKDLAQHIKLTTNQ